ncbi:nuclear transport factor 2 family protein [Streptomyces shenzhenensis]|uniref:nuclear transport factor 2 family protein n=1 Tax=Streptomyces shenzhenensis TaxID=943815 RepID=UPI00382CDA67
MPAKTPDQTIELCERWLELYNSDIHRMIDEFYPDDFVLAVMGVAEITDKGYFHKFEDAFLAASPERKARAVRITATGEDATLELVLYGTTVDGTKWEVPLCELLTFENGLIARDVIYLDPAKLPVFPAPEM